jgi:hypothetical protein
LELRVQTLNLGRAAYGKILILTWGEATEGRNFDVDIGRAALEAWNMTWNLDTNSGFDQRPRKTTENLNRLGLSQDLS